MTQLFKPWLDKRAAGIWLHPSCLPSDQGVGCFGESAYQFVDFAASVGMSYWQLCPMGPTGYGDSPYQCFSAFAGNPYFIDFKPLAEYGLVLEEELALFQELPRDRVEYGFLYEYFWTLMTSVYKRYQEKNITISEYEPFDYFKKEQAFWLDPYVTFRALKNHFLGQSWLEWSEECRHYDKIKGQHLLEEKSFLVGLHQFVQYLVWSQWKLLKAYANSKGISIIGDVPIFVALDSADVWAYPEIFHLDEHGLPKHVAGVPPDYFSKTGQLWGNPLFDWDALKQNNYKWWIDRLRVNFELYDVVRIDHFRGFDSYWAIPYGSPNAIKGEWLQGPGIDFFKALKKHFSNKLQLIAEDLGELTPGVHELREQTGIPGMAILQFGFGGDDKNIHLPHNYVTNQVVYPGSHDNNTLWGWYNESNEMIRHHFRTYFSVEGEDVAWDAIRGLYESSANLVIITLQDIMSLGAAARMNTPGVAEGNWQWRYSEKQLNKTWQEKGDYLRSLAELYKRC